LTGPFDRLLHLGNVVVDVVLDVPSLPERGGDVLASGTRTTPGGGFNVMVAATRQGLPASYAGAHGSGPFAELARAALAGAGIGVAQRPKPGLDTGFVVAIVEAGGERTFVTSPGAEATLTSADLAGIRAGPGDAVYLSGYGLVHRSNAGALLRWLAGLDDAVVVFFDPGPLAASIPGPVLDRVLRRTGWLTCNAREAAALTGRPDPAGALSALAAAGRPGLSVVVRTGREGCLLGRAGADPLRVPGFPVDAIDTSGAGDAHTGTFIAALAHGSDAATAAGTANAAAALSVTRRGPATAPTAAQLARFLAGRDITPAG
jgi:sugar/nucleoside kinase (ribokinase family)